MNRGYFKLGYVGGVVAIEIGHAAGLVYVVHPKALEHLALAQEKVFSLAILFIRGPFALITIRIG